MESSPVSYLVDPISKEPYDLIQKIPYILPCCKKTCSITTIDKIRNTTHICPLCHKHLPQGSWTKDTALCKVLEDLEAYRKTPESQSHIEREPIVKKMCSKHPDKEISYICYDDGALLCLKCVMGNSSHMDHKVEDLQPALKQLKMELIGMKPILKQAESKYQDILKKLFEEMAESLIEEINKKVLKVESMISEVDNFQHKSDHDQGNEVFNIKEFQEYCTTLQQNAKDFDAKCSDFGKEIRDIVMNKLGERLKVLNIEETKPSKPNKENSSHAKVDEEAKKQFSEQKDSSKSDDQPQKAGDTSKEPTLKFSRSYISSNPKPPKTLKGHNGIVFSLQLLPHSQLASGSSDKTIKIWDYKTGAHVSTLSGHANWIHCLQLLPTDQLASGSHDKTIRIWDYRTESCIKTLTGHTGWVFCLQVMHSGELASGSSDKTIKIWNPKTGVCNKTLEGHSSGVYCLELLASGHLASGSEDKTIKIWDCNAYTCLKTLTGHSGCVWCLKVLPSGELASGSTDMLINIWNCETGVCVKSLEGHTAPVRCLQLLPSGELVSGSEDHTVKIWDYKASSCVKTIEAHSDWILCLQVLASGELASGSRDETIKIWE